MSEVPKFVRQRLAQHAAGEHPDANLLAAFAEGALTKSERAQVLAHLSACAACRETVALALPEVPAAAPGAAPAATRWARWPMLRWAGVAAAVVVVAAAVMVLNSRRAASPANAVRVESAVKPAEPKQAEAPSAETKTEASGPDRRAASRTDRDSLRARTENNLARKKDFGRSEPAKRLPGTPPMSAVVQSRAPAQAPAPAQSGAVPAASAARAQTGGQVAGLSGMAMTDQAKQSAAAAPAQVAGAEQSVDLRAQAEVVSAQPRAKMQVGKPLATNQAVGGTVPGPAMEMAVYSTGRARWRISAEGAVERSLDAGQSWQPIAVAGVSGIFRSLAAMENDIWAGGTRGALYHSADGGRTWKRVAVKTPDAALEADIARVEFTDALHGVVITTAGETWSTGDGGASWARR